MLRNPYLALMKAAASGKRITLSADEAIVIGSTVAMQALQETSAEARRRLSLIEDVCPDWAFVDPVQDVRPAEEPRFRMPREE